MSVSYLPISFLGENMHTKATTFKRMEKDRINQTVELCCRDKGFEGDVMPFTSAHPFALLAASGKQCSSVPGRCIFFSLFFMYLMLV